MKICWLNREHTPDCILFMAGWGMGPEPFQNIPAGTVDVLMVYDYRSMDSSDFAAVLSETTDSRLHLVAWSMGVWLAGNLLQKNNLFSATAIGGTCRPIDNTLGIPGHIFDAMIDDFSPAALTDFYRAMFDDPEQADRFLRTRPARLPEEIRLELVNLRAGCRKKPRAADIFDRRLVTSRDRIFPGRNQIRAWGRDNCSTLPLPHFPFYEWPDWASLIEPEICKTAFQRDAGQ